MLEQNRDASMLFYSFIKNCNVKGFLYDYDDTLPDNYQCGDNFGGSNLSVNNGHKVDPCIDLVACLADQPFLNDLAYLSPHESHRLVPIHSYDSEGKFLEDGDWATNYPAIVFENHANQINYSDNPDENWKIWKLENDLEKRTESLIKRIKRIQAKQLEKHANQQLKAFVENQQTKNSTTTTTYCQEVKHRRDGGRSVKSLAPSSRCSKLAHCPISQASTRKTSSTSHPIASSSKGSSCSSVPSTPSLPHISSAEEKIKLIPTEEVKSLSTSALVDLVKKLEKSGPLIATPTNRFSPCEHLPQLSEEQSYDSQEKSSHHCTNSQKYEPLVVNNNSINVNGLPLIEPKEAETLHTVVGTIKTNLKHLETSYDSDATESSSGGESCDEYENVINDNLPPLFRPDSSSNVVTPIHRKSNWKWLNERSAIASRWTWLQAQVADLEFKIRQQNEMYRQLRANKGSIAFYYKETSTCANPSPVPNCLNKITTTTTTTTSTSTPTINSNPLGNISINKTTNNLNGTVDPHNNANTNGISDDTSATAGNCGPTKTPAPTSTSPPTTATTTTTASNSRATNDSNSEDRDVMNGTGEKDVYHCARTLPLKLMRKRKLVRSCNALSGATRKIARYSTVQCSCTNYPRFVSPCVLCNGRYSHLQMIDTDCMPNYERYALLDPSYHPVLSLPNDVALGLHFSKILKKETVQKPLSTKNPHKRRSNHSEFSFKFGSDGKKINRRKSQAVISSTKLKKKYDGTTKKKFAKGNRGYGRRSNLREKNDHANGSGDENRTESPSPSPLSAENSSVPIHRRRRSEQYAYDINNIVIPYSIASTTRVEKLKYKEIITPKWRYVEVNNNSCLNDETEETDEDTSDEVFAIRHLKCEIDERKQFSTYLKNPTGAGPGRGRGARARLDSNRSEGGKSVNNSNSGGKNINIPNINSSHTINMNESTQNVDLSSQDSLVTTPFSLCMNNNGDSVSSTPTIHSKITTPTTPIISNPIDPLMLIGQENITTHGTPAKTTERHGTSSSSKREDSVEEDNYVEVHPYEKRTFPISDQEYEEMLRISVESLKDDEPIKEIKTEVDDETGKDGPKDGEKKPRRLSQNCDDSLMSDENTRIEPGKVSRCSSSTSSSVLANGIDTDDDATDPEWEPAKGTKDIKL